jgi:exopolysaccharide biosynthesis protein
LKANTIEKDEIINKKQQNKNQEVDRKKKKTKKMPILVKIVIAILILITVGTITLLTLFYGPISTFRDWWITTAMTTMSHKYLAEWFFDEETINAVLEKNKIEETDETTDTSLIVVTPNEEIEKEEEEIQYQNEYEKQLFAKNLDKEEYNIYAESEDYRIIEIEGKGYSGYLAAIYDPSKIKVATSKYIGSAGQYLTDISKQNDAIIAINGGGFLDENSKGNGSTPLGIVISEGRVIANNNNTVGGGLIGFDKENKLVVGKMSLAKAQSLGIRDAVTFSPFLIVNGESVKISGNGGWGTAPRTVIGQRQDGVVLFLVLDGRRLTMPGASIKDLIEIMENYGAYNAANLDGGTSSAMTFNHKIINDPVDASGNHRTRHIATAFVFTDDE